MNKKTLTTLGVFLLIIAVIFVIESRKADQGSGDTEVIELSDDRGMLEPAKEITTPDGFINTDPFKLSDLIGEKVILVDFWTYSCINCQRTTPYLNSWHDKYADDGLVIVGIHTPEFGFEKEYDNVLRAVEQFEIKYPVVLDNDYSTWRAYKNRYWPRKYLIDIDGYIVYDHIGEGAYEETEEAIRRALEKRYRVLGIEGEVTEEGMEVGDEEVRRVESPEVYFGSHRNDLLANGEAEVSGVQTFVLPEVIGLNKLYLEGEWDIQDEYAANRGEGTVVFRYSAKNVFMVAGGASSGQISVYRDDEFVRTITVDDEELYTLIEGEEYGAHTLRLEVTGEVEIFTFTFG